MGTPGFMGRARLFGDPTRKSTLQCSRPSEQPRCRWQGDMTDISVAYGQFCADGDVQRLTGALISHRL